MLDFLFTTVWGWLIIAHVTGWVVFQPYVVRGIDRNVLVNCPEGNTDAHCKKYHEPTCKMRNGLSKNVDSDALWWGSILAFFWEFVALGVFFVKRANKPDAIQQEVLKGIDEQSLEKLKEYHARMNDKTKALGSKSSDEESGEILVDEEDEVEIVDAEIVSDEELRAMHRRVKAATRAYNRDSYNPKPEWMKDKR